ncbi:DNA double-strand break repair nuclease NurA [Halarchaeum sp. CBA1220]|uniref:DNA double-strand break repair nuclease NurA n=1 Tax=Halarchaeum sp. CBA1220 TaxID=1853682 RepID=UPI000F3A9E17|nr:DNA double-strand break repair nuclease NurA [Halarchaeum sp. CBA1220]QLC33025.1 DNA double-strand break repair nuclease NurA [Halarchaeum sp. CBA1220]
MTLDPVHFAGIPDLVRDVGGDVDEAEHRADAEAVWETYFDPLYDDGAVLRPIDEQARYLADLTEAGASDPAFDAVHGLDSGTINPRAFKNGIVLDVAQAAMGVAPGDTGTHRHRTVIATMLRRDRTAKPRPFDPEAWTRQDEGYWRGQAIDAPHVERNERAVVHALSLYLAESEHAHAHFDSVAEFLLLDGPLYPKLVTNWLDQNEELAALPAEDGLTRRVIENYLGLVERAVETDTVVGGFVKNVSARGIVRALDAKTHAPWLDDAELFGQLLERRDDRGERLTSDLAYTNWFLSRVGYDREFSTLGGRLDLDLALDAESYEVAFCVLYDPRTDTVYKAELPRVFAEDDGVRERVTDQLVRDVAAAGGPPDAVGRADELARISVSEKRQLVDAMADAMETEPREGYDVDRWGLGG